ncbi:fructose 1,6-bisphosphatase II [endosymbiont of Acanthamoeba sp. UWC8]|uniref:class II fructose-bisphosphatase n=1 Tax=endosymbiont of Acanthamoeba sp. UWC8 TaxID=86106 RepID=UPI0004D1776C|nr:class II fructose-bisphosphatase [endosymbiont of Acanthamoeba sp. UWC8]AIF81093.1 fructose 1,6-bisphosphatase II [endosymbiont of Acanthamoeba sp. UWC8]
MKAPIKKIFNEQVEMLNERLHVGILKATKAAAKACYSWIGKGDEKAADQAAVNAMRSALNELDISGVVAIGEGERDEAPMLYIGEQVGRGGVELDIALDPLEGTTLCAHNAPNSISVMAMTNKNGFLHAPDTYMEKIAVGNGLPVGVIHLDNSIKQNLKNLCTAKKCSIYDLHVCVLNRPRHDKLIADIREAGARVKLIKDGDVMTAIATTLPSSEIDLYIGTGGAPEGVLAAAALKVLGGQMQGRLLFKDEIEEARAKRMGILDTTKVYEINDMVQGEVIFAATGITSGDYLEGLKQHKDERFSYHSLLISSITNMISYHKACEL